MFAALLDTCVLWPSRQRDFLLSLAVEGLYRPLWSGVILDELEHEETAKWLRRGADQADARSRAAHLVREMRRAFDDAEVEGWEGLDGVYGLPDPDDEHVVAAALVGGAGAVVTLNTKDFPADAVPAGIQILTPQDFAANTVALDSWAALTAVEEMAARSGGRGRRLTVDEILDILEQRYHMADAVGLMRALRIRGSVRNIARRC